MGVRGRVDTVGKPPNVFTRIVMSSMFPHFRNVLLSTVFMHQYSVKLNLSLRTCYSFARTGFQHVQLNYRKILMQH